MKIILNNPHDKKSRNFTELYSQNNRVINYPECIKFYPRISAFPSVIVFVPEHRYPTKDEYLEKKVEHPDIDLSFIFKSMDEEENTIGIRNDVNEEDIEKLILNNPHDVNLDINGIVQEYIVVYRYPESMEEIELYEEEWETYINAYPLK